MKSLLSYHWIRKKNQKYHLTNENPFLAIEFFKENNLFFPLCNPCGKLECSVCHFFDVIKKRAKDVTNRIFHEQLFVTLRITGVLKRL